MKKIKEFFSAVIAIPILLILLFFISEHEKSKWL